MSRPTSEWTASMKCATDHPEIRKLYANGGGVAQEWLADQVVKHCCAYGLKDGLVTLADIKSAVAGKVSRPTLTKYINDLIACDALKRVGDNLFYSRLAERICSSFNGRGNKLVRKCKNSFTSQKALFEPKTGCEVENAWPSTVPDLDKDLSQRPKAVETTVSRTPAASAATAVAATPADRPTAMIDTATVVEPTAAVAPEPLAAEATRKPAPVFVEVASAPKLGAVAEAKTQVARQAGFGKKQGSSMADTFLSMGVFASGKSIEDLLAMQDVDLDDLDTEAILAQDRREEAWQATQRVPARRAPGGAAKALPHTGPAPAGTEAFKTPQAPQTTQRLPASVIRYTLGQIAEAIPEFIFGEKEVNALRKWPVTQAQLVDLKNVAVARKRQGKLTVGVGAYLYGAVRRASLGILPTRRGVGAHLASALGSQAGPLP